MSAARMNRAALIVIAFACAVAVRGDGRGFRECSCSDAKGFDASAYWTEQRQRSARALPVPVVTSEERDRLMSADLAFRDEAEFALPASPSIVSQKAGEPAPADVTLAPHDVVGKLFFRSGGVDSYCTAQLIGDRSMILTAAHCVRDKNSGNFHSAFSFIAGFDDGRKRISAVSCVGTWSSFPHARLPNYALDYAFARLVSPLDGHLGLTLRLPVSEWVSVGYPEDVDGGKTQQSVRGSKREVVNYIIGMTENLMNDGASGGGFIAPCGPLHCAVSVNSFRSGAYMYGPYFDGNTAKLYDYVRAQCPKPPS